MLSPKNEAIKRIRKNRLSHEKYNDSMYCLIDNICVQFQDRESWVYEIHSKAYKVKSYTWLRIWIDGNKVLDFDGAKYEARQKAIEFLSALED